MKTCRNRHAFEALAGPSKAALIAPAPALYWAADAKEISNHRMSSRASEERRDIDRDWSAMMAAAQKGDRAAYEVLLKESVPHIRRIVRRSGVRSDNVEDVVQEVLLTIHRARQTFDPSRSFMAWLSAIAQRRAIDSLRQQGRKDRRETSDPLRYEAYPDQDTTPEQAWEEESRNHALTEAVATLSPGQREAVESLAVRQMSLGEAAAATGKSKGALKVNLHRALKTLRARFDGAQ